MTEEDAAYTVWISETGHRLGELTEAQRAFLAAHLVLEGPDDTDYHLVRETVDYLADRGADPLLLDLLRRALERAPGQQEVTISFRPVARREPEPRGPFR